MATFVNKLVPQLWPSFSSASCVQQLGCPCLFQTRSYAMYYKDWCMIRDVKKRKLCIEYAPQRMRINCIRKNKILPKAIRELADQEIAALPSNSSKVHVQNRCVVTSRRRGVLVHWRLSRFIWRHLNDYNLMSGAERAMW